ncbi:hypothetical protein CW304_31210 [Bacillus sp. UFRGS-B20]|nr:hypothetical protein CW304_31210 [Bacillus sp. UFRGS-B20]
MHNYLSVGEGVLLSYLCTPFHEFICSFLNILALTYDYLCYRSLLHQEIFVCWYFINLAIQSTLCSFVDSQSV